MSDFELKPEEKEELDTAVTIYINAPGAHLSGKVNCRSEDIEKATNCLRAALEQTLKAQLSGLKKADGSDIRVDCGEFNYVGE